MKNIFDEILSELYWSNHDKSARFLANATCAFLTKQPFSLNGYTTLEENHMVLFSKMLGSNEASVISEQMKHDYLKQLSNYKYIER